MIKALRSLLFIGLSVVLANCAKTRNSSATAASVPTASAFNLGGNGVCTQGYYVATNGQTVACQIGQPINTGITAPNGYTGNQYPTGVASCQQYTQYYGVQYVPVQNGAAIDCVRYDYVSQYAGGTQYAGYGPEYYYAYPPEASPYSNGGSWAANLGLFLNFNF